MPKCKYRVGLVNLQDCGKEVSATCAECGRPVCDEHARDAGKKVCLECFVRHMPEEPYTGADEPVRATHRRNQLIREGGYRPYYYGSGRMYGEEDYRYFHRHGGAGEREEDDDALDPDDFLDS